MPDDSLPEADRIDGLPHPREASAVIGQEAAEAAFLEAYGSGSLHHAWLLTGPRGVGKATLAWRIARFLLATPPMNDGGLFGAPEAPTSLDIDPDHPVARRLMAGSEGRFLHLRRTYDDKGKRMRQAITVDEARGLKSFFALSAADGGRRVVLVDAADDMNVSAANAILKVLEEPPEGVVFLLISHQPGRLLPTIRSRCRVLRCETLAPEDIARALPEDASETTSPEALGELAAGSVGDAAQLSQREGLATYAEIVSLLGQAPSIDRSRALKLAESAAGRQDEERFDLLVRLIDQFLARLAKTGAGRPPIVEAAPGEAQVLTKLAATPEAARHWADLQQSLGARVRRGRAVNLDPAALILDMVLRINQAAAHTVA